MQSNIEFFFARSNFEMDLNTVHTAWLGINSDKVLPN
jgi:hypothetical protein